MMVQGDKTSTPTPHMGGLLRQLRLQANLTQGVVGGHLDVDRSVVVRWEQGTLPIPLNSLHTLMTFLVGEAWWTILPSGHHGAVVGMLVESPDRAVRMAGAILLALGPVSPETRQAWWTWAVRLHTNRVDEAPPSR